MRFLDLAGGPVSNDSEPPAVVETQSPDLEMLDAEPSNDQSAEPRAVEMQVEVESTDPPDASIAAGPSVLAEENVESQKAEESRSSEVAVERGEAERSEVEERRKEYADRSSRQRSRSPPLQDERHLAFQSYNRARQLDGMAPVAEEEFNRRMAAMGNVTTAVPEDDELLAEAFSESRLTPEEKKQFDVAKDDALRVWIDNEAWRPVPETDAQEGEVIPARFLQRWKPTKEGKKANARVIIQGFKHKDVLSEELVRESPTLSSVGRMVVFVWAVHKCWKVWTADVKSAFMQANSIDETTRIYVRPSSDMRRRLERLIDLKPWELLKATKPAFGDVRAPRQWFETADQFLVEELKFMSHPLDRCVYLSLREAVEQDDPFCCFEKDGKWWTCDGLLGLHVDDFVGAGEFVQKKADIVNGSPGDNENFLNRMKKLSQRFLGFW